MSNDVGLVLKKKEMRLEPLVKFVSCTKTLDSDSGRISIALVDPRFHVASRRSDIDLWADTNAVLGDKAAMKALFVDSAGGQIKTRYLDFRVLHTMADGPFPLECEPYVVRAIPRYVGTLRGDHVVWEPKGEQFLILAAVPKGYDWNRLLASDLE
ncbi:MAG TPA: hypothetical protein VNI20_07740 [Fimbriimonadaceae bacterium]|nr:hypothetical protein [Fimbriimonadaceae bacterium]